MVANVEKLLVTGSSGLIGSEVCRYFHSRGVEIVGVDNNLRRHFFGHTADTTWNRRLLEAELEGFRHLDLDIRNRDGVLRLLSNEKPDAIVHSAAQPSHDKAASIPFDDFDTNALGTFNLIEGARRHCPTAPFVYMSTNKVYGDQPNYLELRETERRYDFCSEQYRDGIREDFGVDQTKHSLFGASKLAADLAVQEYGRYFGMPTCCLRGGCLTGPSHSGVQLHGFLSYLVRCNLAGDVYTIFGYKGKQVRDNIHSVDVARFIEEFVKAPRSGEVYNIGGGRRNSCSILEAFEIVAEQTGLEQKYSYEPRNRIGDHICYYSNISKAMRHYPEWDISVDLSEIVAQLVDGWKERGGGR